MPVGPQVQYHFTDTHERDSQHLKRALKFTSQAK